ncbi:MAG TPA: proton-conducting transporter membrane subunit [Pirellulales bacterium]|nr:proton-conducting transporter membrane subunit [Pirellulales bacterium]
MNLLQLPWLELTIGLALIGSASVAQIREPNRAYRWGLAFTGGSLACSLLAWLGFYAEAAQGSLEGYSIQPWLFGDLPFRLDELNAPLLPAVALLHFLTALATARTHMRRYSVSWSLAAGAIRLATFSCHDPWMLVGLLAVATVPPYVELVSRRRPVGVYVLHMALFVVLLIAGWAAIDTAESVSSVRAQWGSALLMAAVLVRCGTVPAHCWVTDWFEHASFGIAILFVAPLSGVYAAVRLVLPIGPEWVLRSIGLMSLATAVYAAGMATVEREARRFYAYLFLSHASLVLVGLELQTPLSLTASLCLWLSVILSLGGFGLTLRALEARFGRLALVNYHGLYGHSPTLAVCFLLTGLACVGFPATIGFISTELLVDSAVDVSPMVGVAVVAATALNGIAVVRAYLLLFTGARHMSSVSLEIGMRERLAVLTFAALILGGGLFPQWGVESRRLAVERVLQPLREEAQIGKRAPKALDSAPSEPIY